MKLKIDPIAANIKANRCRGKKTAPSSPKNDLQDVLVELPPAGIYGFSESPVDQLQKSGFQLENEFLDLNLVSGKISPEKAEILEKQGYTLYDNSPRNFLPSFPKAELTGLRGAANPWDMPVVKPEQMLKADRVNDSGYTGKNITVAAIDSGFNHPEFELTAWKDFIDKSPVPVDPHGHGTHVAGDVNLVAPDAGIAAIRAMKADGQGRITDIFKAIQWAVSNRKEYNIRVINLSLSCPPNFINLLDLATKQAAKAGITVVAAAGNEGPRRVTIGSPGEEPAVITVGAALDPETVSEFSSRGPTVRGKPKPDLTAPGEFIVSWAPPDSEMAETARKLDEIRVMSDRSIRGILSRNPKLIQTLGLPKNILQLPYREREKLVKTALPPIYMPEEGLVAAPGTSFASPLVAGVTALMLEKTPRLAPEQIKTVLMETAGNMGKKYSHNDQGAGFVNAEKAVRAV